MVDGLVAPKVWHANHGLLADTLCHLASVPESGKKSTPDGIISLCYGLPPFIIMIGSACIQVDP